MLSPELKQPKLERMPHATLQAIPQAVTHAAPHAALHAAPQATSQDLKEAEHKTDGKNDDHHTLQEGQVPLDAVQQKPETQSWYERIKTAAISSMI